MTEKMYDPITNQNLDVVDCTEEAADAALENLTSEVISPFTQLDRNLLPPDVEDGFGRCSPQGRGVAVGTYFGKDIIGFDQRTAIFWRLIAPEFLNGDSSEAVFLTSSNHARRGAEAFVAYAGGRPALFLVWDWRLGKFVQAFPYARWGPHKIQIDVGGEEYSGLQVANSTYFDGSRWWNHVAWYNGATSSWDVIWHNPFSWDPEAECKYFFFGPCIEPKGTNDYGTTNKLGYADAMLMTDRVKTKLLKANSIFIYQKDFGFEPKIYAPNHTVLAQ
jgi:hypothetical protein